MKPGGEPGTIERKSIPGQATDGASSLGWRVSVPHEVSQTERKFTLVRQVSTVQRASVLRTTDRLRLAPRWPTSQPGHSRETCQAHSPLPHIVHPWYERHEAYRSQYTQE